MSSTKHNYIDSRLLEIAREKANNGDKTEALHLHYKRKDVGEEIKIRTGLRVIYYFKGMKEGYEQIR